VLLHMCKNQEIQDKLFDELKSIMPDPNMKVTAEMLNEMKYLRACIRETHRSD